MEKENTPEESERLFCNVILRQFERIKNSNKLSEDEKKLEIGLLIDMLNVVHESVEKRKSGRLPLAEGEARVPK
jgi:hypothetical protein